MLIDITLRITPKMIRDAQGNEKKALGGHLGTHFDVMNRKFPLEYSKRSGIVFDVSAVQEREIEVQDVDLSLVHHDMFVAFYTGFIEHVPYGSPVYFSKHPQLSHDLIDCLVELGVSLIGVDFAGIRRGREHTPKDQYCADRGVFIIENLCNLKAVLEAYPGEFTVYTFPMSYADMTGLPCRIIAEMTQTELKEGRNGDGREQ